MGWLSDYLVTILQRWPLLVRLMTGLARKNTPVLKLGSSVFVLSAEDVKDTLARDGDRGDFELGQPNGCKMLQGPFLLGMDASWLTYIRQRAELEQVIIDLDMAYDAALHAACTAKLPNIQGQPSFDVARDYAEPVVLELVQTFYGIDPPAEAKVLRGNTPEQHLGYLLRSVGSVIAFSSPAPFGRQHVAEKASAALKTHLEDLIEHRCPEVKRKGPGSTVIDQLIHNELGRAPPFDTCWVRASLAGLVLAGSTAIVKAFCHATDQLLKGRMGGSKRTPLLEITNAAQHGQADRVRQMLLESLRYNPTFPIIPRFCPRSTKIGPRPRQIEVSAGSNVVPVLISAMFDESYVIQAESFGYQRPDTDYLHFGHGQHECLGKDFATRTLVQMGLHVFGLPGFDQARGTRLKYDGVAVDSYEVTL